MKYSQNITGQPPLTAENTTESEDLNIYLNIYYQKNQNQQYILNVAGGEFKYNCKDERLVFIVAIFVLIESTFNFKSFNEYAPGK